MATTENTMQSHVVFPLDSGLEVWKVFVDEVKEQDENARVMDKAMYDRLAETIGRDQRLESLPLLALVDGRLEAVSGHHRLRAARTAELMEIFALVDVSGLDRDAIRAKQLAHNAIAGKDDPQMVARIYSQIQSVDARLEAFIDPASVGMKMEKISVAGLDIGLAFRSTVIHFMPTQHELWERALDEVKDHLDEKHQYIYLMELGRLDEFRKVTQSIGGEYDIKAINAIFSQMAEMVLSFMGEPIDEPERRPLRDIFGTGFVTKEQAEHMEKVVRHLTGKTGPLSPGDRRAALSKLMNAITVPDTLPS
jgi:hypothetical protein